MSARKQHIVLEAKNLSIGYNSKKKDFVVASNIDIKLYQGELIGLIGANGVGKSTLLRTLTNVQEALSGDISINTKQLKDYSNLELAKSMSLVLTEHSFSKNLSVFDLIALGRQPYTDWIGNLTESDKEVVYNVMDQVSIQDLQSKKCYELSDGQLQKVMIARALAQDTDIIILDEPTTHLDMYHKAHILNLLKKLAATTQKTILFSSHEIDLAIQLCDKLIVMTGSEVVSGTAHELIDKGSFNQLFPEDLIVFDEDSRSFRVNK